MASAVSGTRWRPRVGQADPRLSGIEQWFIRQGVPQFMSGYSPRDNMPVLFYLLLIVVAFDLAIQPWVTLDPVDRLILPAVLVCLGLLIKVTIVDQVWHLHRRLVAGKEIDGKTSYPTFTEQLTKLWSSRMRPWVLLVSVYVIGCLLFLLDRRIHWSDFSVDFFVITGLLWISAMLYRPDVWQGNEEELRERRRFYVLLVAAVVAFALEGSILPEAPRMLDGVVGTVMPAAVPVPQALAALLVTCIIAVQGHGLLARPDHVGHVAGQQLNRFHPAVPLLVLVFCAETAIFPYVGPTWLAAVVPLALLAAVVLLLSFPPRRRRPRTPRTAWWPGWLRWPRGLTWLKSIVTYRDEDYPGVTLFIVLFLLACPLTVGTLAALDEEGSWSGSSSPAAAGSAFVLTLGVNLFYLGLAGGIAGFGLDRVAAWAIREAWTDWRERISNLGRGLSILVVFTTFLLLTAETWETMAKISRTAYLLVLASILGLTGAFHLLISVQTLSERSKFKRWGEVRKAAREPASRKGATELDTEIEYLLRRQELSQLDDDSDAPEYPLRPLETINGVIVLMTYEILFFIPVAIVGAVTFFILGRITVSPPVAGTWVFGDGTPPEAGQALASRPLLEQPWLRVALLLTAFSILYLAVDILSDSGKRSSFFGSADTAVRRRLAVRLAYHHVLHQVLPQRLLSEHWLAQARLGVVPQPLEGEWLESPPPDAERRPGPSGSAVQSSTAASSSASTGAPRPS